MAYTIPTRRTIMGVAVIVAIGIGVGIREHAPAERVYTVAQVQAGLAHHPKAWVGRTVLVRGWAGEAAWGTAMGGATTALCVPHPNRCAATVPRNALIHVALAGNAQPQTIRQGHLLLDPGYGYYQSRGLWIRAWIPAPGALQSALSHLPMIGAWLPFPGPVRWDAPGTYRVQVLPIRHVACQTPTGLCDSGVLDGARH